ncbi:MAG: flippase-like domain-containing protein [Bdellovibrionales bacterium]|nr:flippase-like domain-containing protein [Bdellovibrionales bacterium]
MSLGTLLKIGLSTVMLVIVFQFVEIDQLIHTISQIPLWCALFTVVGYVLGQSISAFKWKIIARSAGIDSSFANILKAYFIGMFVNSFGLGIIGGDVARGILLTEHGQSKTLGVATVFADRVHGLAILSLMGICATLLFASSAINERLVLTLVVLGALLILGWFYGPRIAMRLAPKESSMWRKLDQLKEALPTDLPTLTSISLLSLTFHLLQIGLHWVIAQGLGVSLPLGVLFVSIPFVNILSSLPMSWNGLGVREGGYIFFFCSVFHYLTEEQALVMGAIWLLAVTTSSAVGGLVAFASKDLSTLRLRAAKEV